MLESLFNKDKVFNFDKLFYKESPAQVFSCEYCEIFKTTYFEERLRTAASDFSKNFRHLDKTSNGPNIQK